MADFKKLTVDGNTYDVKDAVARSAAAAAQTSADGKMPISGTVAGPVNSRAWNMRLGSTFVGSNAKLEANAGNIVNAAYLNLQEGGDSELKSAGDLDLEASGDLKTNSETIDITFQDGRIYSDHDCIFISAIDGVSIEADHGDVKINNEIAATQPWVLDQIPEPGDLGTDPSPIPFNLAYNKTPTPPLHVIDKKMQKLIGGSIAWNQLKGVGETSVTVRSGHKYIAYIGGTWSLGASTGAAVSTPGSSDMFFDLTYAFGSDTADAIYALGSTDAVALFRKYFPETSYMVSKNVIYHAEPYKAYNETSDASEHKEYALASGTVQLLGRYTLNNGKLECDGDEWTPDGTITRKYGLVDLGDLSWGYSSSRRIFYTTTSLPNCVVVGNNAKGKILCPGYDVVTANNQYDNSPDMSVSIGSTIGSQILMCVNDAYTTAADFKTAMSGIDVLYPLASETTEASTTYEETMTIYTGGFEELQDYQFEERYTDVAVPIGSLALYKRKMIALPMAPTEQGSYHLTAYVDNDGSAYYVWEM